MKPAVKQPNFDRVADIYQWAEYLALGTALQRTRTHFVPSLGDRRSALVLGDGDGRFLAALLRSNALITATAVDTSGRMLALLARRCTPWPGRLQAICASALDVTPPPETDLIVSHFFLDCLTQQEVETLVGKMSSACQPGTQWLISDFQVPQRGLLRPIGRMYIQLLYAAFRVLTGLRVRSLPATRAVLEAAGFYRIAYHTSLGVLLYTEVWSLQELAVQRGAQPETTVRHPLEDSR